MNPQNLDIAYAPIVQSGGQYDLKVSAASDERRLEYDVILCSLGARYSMYCANIGRTFLVDPVKQQEEEYKALLQAQDAAINALKEGEPMSAAVTATVKALQVSFTSYVSRYMQTCQASLHAVGMITVHLCCCVY